MYHIKKDKRSEKSTDLISKAYLELLKTNNYQEITVSDIQRISGASRSTFYRNFDTPDDIIRLMCDKGFDEIFKSKNGLLISVNCFNYWFDNSNILEVLIKTGHMDYFSQTFANHLINSNILQKYMSNDNEYRYFSFMLSYAMAGFLSGWIANGRKETKSELFKIIVHSIKTLKPAMLISSGSQSIK